MKKRKLLIIDQHQFGYLIDNYYRCKYLKDEYSIDFLCWDHQLPKVDMDGVRVVYVSRKGNLLIRSMRFLHFAFTELSNKPAFVLIIYFKIISTLLKLCNPSQCFILDIRTGNISRQVVNRIIGDSLMKFEARLFTYVTVISQGLAEKCKITHKAHILPLGADIISCKNKEFNEINLLYVGTLEGRDIQRTIKGFQKFYQDYHLLIPISYLIIGDGPKNEVGELRDLVTQYDLKSAITVAGRIQHNKLIEFFDSANIGVCYIPLTGYYDNQPPTKIFEYLLSGMAVIATQTSENKRIVNPENGVIVRDTVEEFFFGLQKIYEKRFSFDSKKIRESNMEHTWNKIVNENLKPYLNELTINED